MNNGNGGYGGPPPQNGYGGVGYGRGPPGGPGMQPPMGGPPVRAQSTGQADEFFAQMRRRFDSNDVRGTGALDLAQLERALQMNALSLNSSVCGLLLRMHDADRSGNVSFDEFLSIHHFINSVEGSFRHVDRNGDGVLQLSEIQTALYMNRFHLGDGALIALLESFDPMRKGFLNLSEFIGLAAFLTSARGIFSQFDTNHSGTININFDQYCWIVGKLR